jgi:glutathione S-transferase
MPQSVSIARYVARQFKLAGKDDLESAKCDVIVDTIQELNGDYYQAWFHIKDEKQKETEQTKFKVDILPQKLKGLETLMNTYGNGTWAVGKNVTWADLLVYDSIQNLLKIDNQVLDKYATLKKNHQAVEKLPKIADYLANRKETAF